MLTERFARGGFFPGRRFVVPTLIAAAGFSFASLPSTVQRARSEEADAPRNETEQAKKERAARLEIMRRLASSLAIQSKLAGEFVESDLVEAPLLHYTNPAGETLDATVWAWGRRGRPVALASISQERSDAGIEKWSCELVSLADQPIVLVAKSGWMWAPAASGIEWKPVADAPAPGATSVIRARQMKEIARRFSGTGIYQDGKEIVELRLMERPLIRCADSDHGLVDGALYAYAGGTNPEVLLLVECRQSEGEKPVWHHGFARMGAGNLIARLGDRTVWERAPIKSWNHRESYFSTYGSADSVFGADK